MQDNWVLGIYKTNEFFNGEPEVPALEVCKKFYSEFFPAKFYTSPKTYEEINDPVEFSRSLAAPGYYTPESEVEVVIFYGAQDEKMDISIIQDEPGYVPSSILLRWKEIDKIPSAGVLENLLMEFINEFSAEEARVFSSEFYSSNEIYNRNIGELDIPEAINWITWITPSQVKIIGAEKIESIKDIVKVQDCVGGVLITLMPEPFENENPKHQAIRIEVEDRLGLTELYKSGNVI